MDHAAVLRALFRAGDTPLLGDRYLVGRSRTGKAMCWAPEVTSDVLRAMYAEADAHDLGRPIMVYGHTCNVSESRDSFRFTQVIG